MMWSEDSANHDSRWVAWATGPERQRLHDSGESPHDALATLTVKLRRRSN